MFTLENFYQSKEWERFRLTIIGERTKDDGFIYDEVTNKPILRMYDLILHHIEELTPENVNDYNVSLNPKNIMVVSHKTHNLIHDNFNNYSRQQVFLVYGAPLSGKSSWVMENKLDGDLIVDINNIWQMVSGDTGIKSPRLKSVVFKIRDAELDAVRFRLGKWRNAYIVGGYPLSVERERIINEMGARTVHIDTSRAECEERADRSENREELRRYIADWFDRYTPPQS